MKKHLIVIGMMLMLLIVGLSGCTSQQPYQPPLPYQNYPSWHIVSSWDCSPIHTLEEDEIVNFGIQGSATKWKIELIRKSNKEINVKIYSPNYQHLFDEITAVTSVEKVYSGSWDSSTTLFIVENTGCKCQITISEFATSGTC